MVARADLHLAATRRLRWIRGIARGAIFLGAPRVQRVAWRGPRGSLAAADTADGTRRVSRRPDGCFLGQDRRCIEGSCNAAMRLEEFACSGGLRDDLLVPHVHGAVGRPGGRAAVHACRGAGRGVAGGGAGSAQHSGTSGRAAVFIQRQHGCLFGARQPAAEPPATHRRQRRRCSTACRSAGACGHAWRPQRRYPSRGHWALGVIGILVAGHQLRPPSGAPCGGLGPRPR